MARIGKFRIDNSFIQKALDGEEDLSLVFEGLVVLHAERLWEKDETKYTAFSPSFDEIPKGNKPPFYHCNVHSEEGNIVRVEWKREKKITGPLRF